VSTKEHRIAEILADHAGEDGSLLPILHDVQSAFGCVDSESEALIAHGLNLSRADVHGVVSFYHDFHQQPDARPEVQLCRAEACKARGVEALVAGARKAAGERVKLSTVYCLGLCSAGPSARVGDRLYARLDAKGLAQVIENAR
jgi:formate dehydrogenase subunit gamma